jgi:predicted secreted protein
MHNRIANTRASLGHKPTRPKGLRVHLAKALRESVDPRTYKAEIQLNKRSNRLAVLAYNARISFSRECLFWAATARKAAYTLERRDAPRVVELQPRRARALRANAS